MALRRRDTRTAIANVYARIPHFPPKKNERKKRKRDKKKNASLCERKAMFVLDFAPER